MDPKYDGHKLRQKAESIQNLKLLHNMDSIKYAF